MTGHTDSEAALAFLNWVALRGRVLASATKGTIQNSTLSSEGPKNTRESEATGGHPGGFISDWDHGWVWACLGIFRVQETPADLHFCSCRLPARSWRGLGQYRATTELCFEPLRQKCLQTPELPRLPGTRREPERYGRGAR